MLIYHDDEYVRQPKLQKLNRDFLAIPGLHMFGETDFKKAAFPLHEHIHPNRYEFTLILTGTQQYSVNSETYLLTGGDLFMTAPNEVHGSNQMPQSVARFLWFQLDISQSDGFLGLDRPFSDRLYEALIGYRRRVARMPSSDIELLSRSFSCFLADTDAQRRLGHSLFLAFCQRCCSRETIRLRSPRISSGCWTISAPILCPSWTSTLWQTSEICPSPI